MATVRDMLSDFPWSMTSGWFVRIIKSRIVTVWTLWFANAFRQTSFLLASVHRFFPAQSCRGMGRAGPRLWYSTGSNGVIHSVSTTDPESKQARVRWWWQDPDKKETPLTRSKCSRVCECNHIVGFARNLIPVCDCVCVIVCVWLCVGERESKKLDMNCSRTARIFWKAIETEPSA